MSDEKVICHGCAENIALIDGQHRHNNMVFPCTAPKMSAPEMEPDWTQKCDVCEETPIVPATGLCGPCTFGEAATAGGNW